MFRCLWLCTTMELWFYNKKVPGVGLEPTHTTSRAWRSATELSGFCLLCKYCPIKCIKINTRSGARTHDHVIKSHAIYQLIYAGTARSKCHTYVKQHSFIICIIVFISKCHIRIVFVAVQVPSHITFAIVVCWQNFTASKLAPCNSCGVCIHVFSNAL